MLRLASLVLAAGILVVAPGRAQVPAPGTVSPLPPDDRQRPQFHVAEELRFVFLSGAVTPRGRNGNQAEIVANFSVENRGERPVVVAAGQDVRLKWNSDYPVQTIQGMARCNDYGACRRAQATTFRPGTATVVRLVANVNARSPGDEAMAHARALTHVNLYMALVHLPQPGDADHRPSTPDFPRPANEEQRRSISMNFINQRATMANSLTGAAPR